MSNKILESKIVQNAIIWLVLFGILLGSVQADNRPLAAFYIILLIAPAIYLSNLLILPFLRKNNIIFILLFIANTFIFTSIAIYFLLMSLGNDFEWGQYFNLFAIMLLALLFGATVKMAYDSFEQKQQKKEAELKLLKAQLNPHFLFNTLNNLYGLAVIKSDKLPGLMLKLSELLRYSLYDTKESLVTFEKEIQYLESYVSLEKLRLEDQVDIQFVKTGDFTSNKIAPMLLIVFVENAFKHIGDNNMNDKSRVVVDLEVIEDKMSFKCINTMDDPSEATINMESGKSGIGLVNAKKRLDLMYQGRYRLNTNTKDGLYRVELTVDLD